MTRRRRGCTYCGFDARRFSEDISLSPWFVWLYYPLRGLLFGWWIYASYEVAQVWRQIKLTPNFKGLEHGKDMYNAIGLLYPSFVIYVFWALGSCYITLYLHKRCTMFMFTIPEIFLMTFMVVSLGLQAKSLPGNLTECVNPDTSMIFTAITEALPWICDTHYVGESESYKTCTHSNTAALTCNYFKQNWRVTIVAVIFSILNLLIDLWCIIMHKAFRQTFGYMPASVRFVWRIFLRPGRQLFFKMRYMLRRRKARQEAAATSTGSSKPEKPKLGASRSPSTRSQKAPRVWLSPVPGGQDYLPVPTGTVEMTSLPKLPTESALESFLSIDDMFLTLSQFMHSKSLQKLALVSKPLARIVEYHKVEHANFLSRGLCLGTANSGTSCWACGVGGCNNCFNDPEDYIPADDTEHQADFIEALCSSCYFKSLNPMLQHPPERLARASDQLRPVAPPKLRSCGFTGPDGNAPCPHGHRHARLPASSSGPGDRARALCGYSRYCYCTRWGVARTLCASCRVSYRVELSRLNGSMAAGDNLRQLRRERLAREVAKGKTPSSRTGNNQGCVYCGEDLQAWWKLRWWKCGSCWEELQVKLV